MNIKVSLSIFITVKDNIILSCCLDFQKLYNKRLCLIEMIYFSSSINEVIENDEQGRDKKDKKV